MFERITQGGDLHAGIANYYGTEHIHYPFFFDILTQESQIHPLLLYEISFYLTFSTILNLKSTILRSMGKTKSI